MSSCANGIFEPLGMKDSSFYCETSKLNRLVTEHQWDERGRIIVRDRPETTEKAGGANRRLVSGNGTFGAMLSTVDGLFQIGWNARSGVASHQRRTQIAEGWDTRDAAGGDLACGNDIGKGSRPEFGALFAPPKSIRAGENLFAWDSGMAIPTRGPLAGDLHHLTTSANRSSNRFTTACRSSSTRPARPTG
jgi:hypothetical protein